MVDYDQWMFIVECWCEFVSMVMGVVTEPQICLLLSVWLPVHHCGYDVSIEGEGGGEGVCGVVPLVSKHTTCAGLCSVEAAGGGG